MYPSWSDRRIDDGIGPEALAAGAHDFLVKGQFDGPGWSGRCGRNGARRVTVYQRDLVAAELHEQRTPACNGGCSRVR